MPIPLLVPIVLGALGGGSLALWASEPSDSWSDKAVFNSRMKEIHMGILQLNELFAKCSGIHTAENAAPLRAWRDFVSGWTTFYGDTGKLIYFAPSASTIAEAKRKAHQLESWIGSYRELCGGVLPTGSMSIMVEGPSQSARDAEAIDQAYIRQNQQSQTGALTLVFRGAVAALVVFAGLKLIKVAKETFGKVTPS